MADGGLYKLLAWFSPGMPTGAYSYSHGLEWAVEDALVHDAETLHGYVATVLCQGSGRLDAGLLRAAYNANDQAVLEDVVLLAAALRGKRELALESGAQGRALLAALRQAWPAPALDRLATLASRFDVEPPHAVVAGVAAAAHGLPLQATLVRLPARPRGQPGLGRHPPHSARPDRRPAADRGAPRDGRGGGGRGDDDAARRARHGDAHDRLVLDAPRDPEDEVVPVMNRSPPRPAPGRHRRSGRLRHDRARRGLVPASARTA